MNALSLAQWQLTFIRVYIGLNFIPHFYEKLFSNAGLKAMMVKNFASYGLPHAVFFVVLAGCIEFAASIVFTFGVCMRGGAVLTAIYIMSSYLIGHMHDLNSIAFIWIHQPGGGWEYPAFWSAICLSFVLTGGNKLSLDNYLVKYNHLSWLFK